MQGTCGARDSEMLSYSARWMGKVSNPAKSRTHDKGLCDFDSEVRTVDTRDGSTVTSKMRCLLLAAQNTEDTERDQHLRRCYTVSRVSLKILEDKPLQSSHSEWSC